LLHITDKINFRYVTDTLLIAQQIFVQGETFLITEVEELTETISYSLEQNYPNPFNPSTVIEYAVPKESIVNLSIFNVLGELVSTLVNEQKKPGYYEYQFNASDLASGIYIYRIQAVEFFQTKKMILLK